MRKFFILLSAFLLLSYVPVLLGLLSAGLSALQYFGVIYDAGFAVLIAAVLQVALVFLVNTFFFAVLYFSIYRPLSKAPVGRWLADIVFLLFSFLFLVSISFFFFPLSKYSYASSLVVGDGMAAFFYFFVGLLACGLLYGVLRLRAARRLPLSAFISIILMLVVVSQYAAEGERVNAAGSERNVFIIGVDSLSGQAFESNRGLMPNTSGLLLSGVEYKRAYTTLGRTYPAWVSILTGAYPKDTGAFFNLRGLSHTSTHPNVLGMLAARGYRKVYAIDERRFNNMDESFGFDVVVGPEAGVLDFIVQPLVDTPLSNMLFQFGFTSRLLPWTKNNVAAVQAYSDSGFVDDVLSSVQAGPSHFMAVHFETSHFPFKSRHFDAEVITTSSLSDRYLNALKVVDGQIGQLVEGYRLRGLLNDALIIVLSDHGEALGAVESEITLDRQSQSLASYGHGTNLLSDHQNRIIMGVVQYEEGKLVKPARPVIKEQVSLLDVRALVENYVKTGQVSRLIGGDCIIVETGLRLPAAENYENLKESEVVKQGAGLYQLSSDGLLSLKEDLLPELLAMKDVGLRCVNKIVWFSAHKNRYYAYSLADDGRPDFEIEPDEYSVNIIAKYREEYNERF
ncbi:sulfatase-like hydrolase/transferase [Halopseudomonas pachastrellae]|uniref:sulfatase-like hydrolase/transferase n=1 Tax=Halopseudomonas pachastrellae TaxID=254161 RepID=UPI003D7D03CB